VSLFFASWMKCSETLGIDEFPHAGMSFERLLHFGTTPFASIGDILKAVDEENRRDLRYCHLAFAIWTDFHSRHYGIGQVDAHDASLRPAKCRGEQKAHPGLGACKSEKQELELARSLCDSGSITNMLRLLSRRVEKKVTTSADGRLAEDRRSRCTCPLE
jgi:hypothetical protein